VLFDLLFLDGEDLRELPWKQRRERLERLGPLLPAAFGLSPVRLGSQDRGYGGEHMVETAREKGLEGVIGKQIDSVYEAGQRSGLWVKYKLVQEQELVVGGWVPEVSLDGKLKPDHIGAILLGYYGLAGSGNGQGHRALHFAGAVGTGFTHQTSMDMVKRLKPLRTSGNPFDESAVIRKFRAPVQFVEPKVVVQVEYRRWPAGGLMHQAAFKGLRNDKAAKEVVREMPAEPSK
jgi:bifunctional non-homologous end joining protein LigD